MVFRGELDSRTTLASVKDTSVSLAVGSHWIAAWDLGGRLYSVWKNGHTFRRGLNGRVLHKWSDGRGAGVPAGDLSPYDSRSRVHIDGAEAHAFADEAAAALRRAIDSMAREPNAWTDRTGRHHPDAAALALFERCAAFNSTASEADAARFATVFSPIGILPPDQYLSIVVQATEGCSFGTCTFCDLYHQRYRVKTADEFRAHAAAVRDYLGDSAILRGRSVFLGAANALAVPMPRLVQFLDDVQDVFGMRPEGQGSSWPDRGRRPPARGIPVHAFLDGFTGLHKTAADFATLRAKGVRMVYIGLESGHDPLLAFARKPATRDQAVETVRALKAGGISVGVIVMAGLGGRRFSRGHVADTIKAINSMDLDDRDLLYFSDLVERPGTAYPHLAAEADSAPLPLDERLEQIAAIRAGLRFRASAPRAARYDVREFIY